MLSSFKNYHQAENKRYCSQCKQEEVIPNLSTCTLCWFAGVSERHLGTPAYRNDLMEIWAQQKFTCPYSNDPLIPGVNMSLDHKLPSSRFKSLSASLDNLQWVTQSMNSSKCDMTDAEYRHYYGCELNSSCTELLDQLFVAANTPMELRQCLSLMGKRAPTKTELLFAVSAAGIKVTKTDNEFQLFLQPRGDL